jgi:hypothetical protein
VIKRDRFDVIDSFVYTLERLCIVPTDDSVENLLDTQQYSGFNLVQDLMTYWNDKDV